MAQVRSCWTLWDKSLSRSVLCFSWRSPFSLFLLLSCFSMPAAIYAMSHFEPCILIYHFFPHLSAPSGGTDLLFTDQLLPIYFCHFHPHQCSATFVNFVQESTLA